MIDSTDIKNRIFAFAAAAALGLTLAACGAAPAENQGATDGPASSEAASPAEEAANEAAKTAATTIPEADLDKRIGSYTCEGKTVEISAREVIEDIATLEAYAVEGGYTLPSADDVLAFARNKIILAEAEKRGVTVTEEDALTYAREMLGAEDFATVGAAYGIDEETAKRLLTESAMMAKVREEVVTIAEPTLPDAPVAPEEGAEDTPTADYAAYIIGLAGDEWDSAAGTWAAEGGAYQSALATYEITADSATYEAASAAYYVAYNEYSNVMSETSMQWSNFVNGILAGASIQIDHLNS